MGAASWLMHHIPYDSCACRSLSTPNTSGTASLDMVAIKLNMSMVIKDGAKPAVCTEVTQVETDDMAS